jgi:pimeloyl-ACP methyl ester carboxylesterase
MSSVLCCVRESHSCLIAMLDRAYAAYHEDRHEEARALFSEVLRAAKAEADFFSEANALNGLGNVERALNRNEEARKHFSEAQRLHKQIGNKLGEANALFGLGEIERAGNREAVARKHYQDAAILFGLADQEAWKERAESLATKPWPDASGVKSGTSWWSYLTKWPALLIGLSVLGATYVGHRALSDGAAMPPNATAAAWHTVSTPPSDTAIVFIHGIFSGPGGAWGRWPDEIAKDGRVSAALGAKPDVYLAGYHTSLDSGNYKMEDAADALRTQLRTANASGQVPALARKRIIFIAHSTGGIVVRDVLERFRDDFTGKTVGLVLMASPSRGSAWADRLDMLARLANNKMAQQLSPKNDYLTNLDKRFADFVQKPPFKLSGLDVFEQKFVIPNRFFGTLFAVERVVTPEAQSSYFGSAKIAADTDHFTVVKPQDASHPSHQYLVDFLTHTFDK